MADSQRATASINWRLGFTGEPPQSKAFAPVCQDGRKTASARAAPPKFHADLAFKRPLSLSLLVLPVGNFTFASAGTIEVTTGAVITVGIAIVALLAIIWARGRANARLAERNGELVSALKRSEGNARESEAALKKQVERLKHQNASLLAVPSQEPLREVGTKVRIAVPPDGSEVFLPLLDPLCVYQITIQGTCQFSESAGWFSKRGASADAMYRTDRLGNFLTVHDFVKLKDIPIRHFLTGVPPEAMPGQDRKAHVYKFRIDGCAKKISARFWITSEKLSDVSNDPLTLTVEPLPVGTPSPAAGERREEAAREQAKEAERVARESAKRTEQTAKETAKLRAKLESLSRLARFESHFLDPKFQEDFAKRDPTEILKTRSPEWRKEYSQFMANISLKSLAEKEAPEVIQWLEARVKIAQLAERAIVAPPPTPKEMSAEEAQAEMIRKKAVQHGKKIALAKLKGEKAAEADAVLESLPLDGDLKERLKTELTDSILDDEGEHEGRKDDVTL